MNTAIIVAAGRGTRMGPGIDKLFLEVAGLPVVAHTWRRFDRHPEIHHLCLVVRPGLEADFEELATRLDIRKPYTLVPGGAERQDSVWNGLIRVPSSTEIIAIQDGARPCTSDNTISRCLESAKRTGAAVAAQRAVDTFKEADNQQRVVRHLDRSRLWSVQTPQCFRLPALRSASTWAQRNRRHRGLRTHRCTGRTGRMPRPQSQGHRSIGSAHRRTLVMTHRLT